MLRRTTITPWACSIPSFRNLIFHLQIQNEYIAHLKDQLQELKAKTNLENGYMKKITDLQIAQTQKKGSKSEEQLLEEIEVSAATLGRKCRDVCALPLLTQRVRCPC